MQPPREKRLSGNRLHLSHGPIDLIISAEGDREAAFSAATDRFQTILTELVAELPRLRQPLGATPFSGPTARRMASAIRPHTDVFVTPMAAVAGSVADEILAAMTGAATLTRAAVNNGGDIALHLASGQNFTLAMASADAHDLGRIDIRAEDDIHGIATSGRHGRSHSLGIADSVTVLASTAAAADAAATLIANAVDLPGHPGITRAPANSLSPDSDLGDRLVTIEVANLTPSDISAALDAGEAAARKMHAASLIRGAALFLAGQNRILGETLTRSADEMPYVLPT
ncbi:UPF0280 family protein [Silicimonas sp. MF1-12-2]|uniref:UPF0280 family protein n=1 Tax=Silicimonas sp. MF1-12-2 TaxID=3384793 RepID=UPI0039B68A1C